MASATKLTRQVDLRQRLLEARAITDELFSVVRAEALYDRPIAERHRIIFYVGHLEAFDWNLLNGQCPGLKPFDPALDRLFAFGIDPVDGQLPSDQRSDWPSLDEVERYNARVRAELDHVVDSLATELPHLLHIAIEHRLMHAETLAYMFHRLPFERKVSQSRPQSASGEFSPQMIDIPAGSATLGLRSDDKAHPFGWDNEFDVHQVQVPPFRIDKFMVTNGEYLQFVEDGGYRRPELWANGDWEWTQQARIESPSFWMREDNRWLWRGMFEAFALPLDWPVYVSHAEATAYARWANKALPTEAQWHRAAYCEANGQERRYPWGLDLQAGKANCDFSRWDPVPVNCADNNVSALGAVGMLGNGWEWTSTTFAPFAGFQPFSFYPGYSANFFDGKHFVMKGGSARTSATLLRRSFRNWFQSHYQFVYAGIRCVSNSD